MQDIDWAMAAMAITAFQAAGIVDLYPGRRPAAGLG